MGNRSTGGDLRGVPRMLVKLPGVLVKADLCVPRAHAHAIWLLPWVEALSSGRSFSDLVANPPWPLPNDPLVARHLTNTLIDLRWAVPDWTGDGVVVAPDLAAEFRAHGRTGLARVLFDATVLPGEWWADGLGGTVLSRQTAVQFDWDLRRRADHELPMCPDPQALVDDAGIDMGELVRKLRGASDIQGSKDRAFLGTALTVGDRKDILFPMVGEGIRLLPDELAELEQVLETHAPELFGARAPVRSRVVRLEASPVERLAADVERLASDPSVLGRLELVRERVARLAHLAERTKADLTQWFDRAVEARLVAGPTQRHFDAVAETCSALPDATPSVVLLTTAFLNVTNVGQDEGLAEAFRVAPASARFLVVYGHANDDLPAEQSREMEAWRQALVRAAPSLDGRVVVAAGRRRSHEKVMLTSVGDWMLGSWNAGSSRPHATVFECSVAGRSVGFATTLLGKLSDNVEGADAEGLVAALAESLRAKAGPVHANGAEAVDRLLRAIRLVGRAVPESDGSGGEAWVASVQALRAAFLPFLTRVHAEVIDQHQTRDAFLALVGSARRDLLLASDRLADSALDVATLRDLRGDGRSRPVVRVVWGREWAGRGAADRSSREQLQRARKTVREARALLGEALLTREEPMENHAKILVVDGLRGIVTSENLLSYGGEKGRYESRELGIVFRSPTLARHLLGRALYQWPDALQPYSGPARGVASLPWVVAGNEAWHGLAPLAEELDFEWGTARYLQQVVHHEVSNAEDDDARVRAGAWAELEARTGRRAFDWVQDEGTRLGLLAPVGPDRWRPYDAATREDEAEEPLSLAEAAVAARPVSEPRIAVAGAAAVHELVARTLEQMVEVPAGSFVMGDDRVRAERPRHRVTLTRAFLVARTPVTQGLWEGVMGRLPHLRDVERHPDFPVIHVAYADMTEFVRRLNALPGGGGFDLPTEAQWEYACRAGSASDYCFGDDPGPGDRPGMLERHAWTKRNAGGRLRPVGELLANAFGLHDMHGLVYETMRDGPRTYRDRAEVDPIGPLDGPARVARGGFWGRFPVDARRPEQEHFRCASRQVYEKSHRVSFRLVRNLQEDR